MLALLTIILAQCPTAADMEGRKAWRIPQGCVAPVAAYLVSSEQYRATQARVEGLDVKVADERASKLEAREERDACHDFARTELDALRLTLQVVQSALGTCAEPPSRATWALLGSGAGVIVCAGGVILGATLNQRGR